MQHYCKTILEIYGSIPKMVERIDSAVYHKAVKSHNYGGKTTYQQMAEIVALISAKNDLLLLRRITSETFDRLPDTARMLLKGKYVYKLDNETVIERAKLSMRTFFRKLTGALDAFCGLLALEGYDEKWFADTYLSQNWIRKVAKGEKKKNIEV